MRLVAVLGGVAALGLAAFMLTFGHSSGSTEASVGTIKPLHPVRPLGTHGTVRGKPKPAAKAARPSKAPARPKAKPASAKPKPAPKPVVLVAGLPPDLASSLRKHALVVVALFNPQAKVDSISRAEASAAAALMHVGFVPLDVLEQREAGPLMRQLGVLPEPAVLVYRRPGRLVARFDGFADRDTIAQAVANAASIAP
jgi:hypothetical protein